MIENVGSSQYTLIIPHRVIQLTTISFWVPETRLHLPQVNKFPPKRVKNLATPSSIFILSSSTGQLCSQPIRGNVHQIGRMFPEHVERSFLDPEYSFIAVQRILPTRFARKGLPNYEPTRFAKYFRLGSRTNIRPIKNGL